MRNLVVFFLLFLLAGCYSSRYTSGIQKNDIKTLRREKKRAIARGDTSYADSLKKILLSNFKKLDDESTKLRGDAQEVAYSKAIVSSSSSSSSSSSFGKVVLINKYHESANIRITSEGGGKVHPTMIASSSKIYIKLLKGGNYKIKYRTPDMDEGRWKKDVFGVKSISYSINYKIEGKKIKEKTYGHYRID